MLVEVKLDLLVGNVDAELLERVLLEVFKTKYVQDADVKALVVLSAEDEDKIFKCIYRIANRMVLGMAMLFW